MAGQHARLSPSGSGGWSKCPGKPNAEAAVAARRKAAGEPPAIGNEAARKGSAGHALIAMELEGVCKAREYLGKEITYDEEGIEPPWLVDEELVSAAETCVQIVWEKITAYGAQGFEVTMLVEQRVVPGNLFTTPRDDCWGSADVILLVFDTTGTLELIEIIDHKLGSGIQVPATSTQARLYGLGAIAEHATLNPVLWPTMGLRTSIIQPLHHLSDPTYPVVSKDWTLLDMIEFSQDISLCAVQTDDPNAPRIPGEEQCQFCDDRADCPALREHALREASHVFHNLSSATPQQELEAAALTEQPYLDDPDTLSPETKARILLAMPLIRSWLNAVEESARKAALSGTKIPGRKLVNGRSSRAYTDEEEVRALMSRAVRTQEHGGKKLRREDYLDEKVISPAQAEKRIKPVLSTKMWNKIAAFIEKKPGAAVLVEESDPRDEIITDATKVFQPIPPAAPPEPANAPLPAPAEPAAPFTSTTGFSALD